MLSKLLSNITTEKSLPGDEGSPDKAGKQKGMRSSQKVFQSLLQSLQNEGSSNKGQKQLMSLAGKMTEGEQAGKTKNGKKNILGGSFININTDGSNKGSPLKNLQQEFKNIKAVHAGEQKAVDEEKEKNAKSVETKTRQGKEAEKKEAKTVDKAAATEGKDKTSEGKNVQGSNTEEDSQKNKKPDNKVVVAPSEKAATKDGKNGQIAKQEKNVNQGKDEKGQAGNIVTSKDKSSAKKQSSQKGVDIPQSSSEKGEGKNSSTGSSGTSSKSKAAVTTQQQNQTDASKGKEHAKASPTEIGNKETAGSGEPGITNKTSGKAETIIKETKGGKKGASLKNKLPGELKKEIPQSSQQGQKQKASIENTQSGRDAGGGQTAKSEATEQQRKIVSLSTTKNLSANVFRKGMEVKSAQVQQQKKSMRQKGNGDSDQSRPKINTSESRNKLLNRLGISGAQSKKQSQPLNLQNFSEITAGASSSMEFKDQALNIEEQLSENITSTNEQESQSNSKASSMRLGQLPITNVSLRKKILPGLTQRVQQATSTAKENPGSWQKHSFTLDDGKNIQLSVRESKGVIQVKMGSMNVDLSKLLQQHIQQIREHLKQEFGSDIDLQFENQQQGEESQFSEQADSESSDQQKNYRNTVANEGMTAESAEQESSKIVRNFGYNQMEWTA